MIWEQVRGAIGDGNAVLAWAAPNDAGFSFETCGQNRRIPVDLDGFRLVSFAPRRLRNRRGANERGTAGTLFDIVNSYLAQALTRRAFPARAGMNRCTAWR